MRPLVRQRAPFFVTSLRVRFWGAQAASLQASAACRREKVDFNDRFSQKLFGQRPKRAGWQPALPQVSASIFVTARKFLMPFPCAIDNGIESLELRAPAELTFNFFG